MNKLGKVLLSMFLLSLCGGNWGTLAAPQPAEQRAAKLCYERGLERFRAGDLEAAIVLMRASLLLNPKLLAAQFWVGRFYAERKEWAAAEVAFRKVLAEKPNSLEAHYWLGRVYQATHRLQEARREYEFVVRLGVASRDSKDAAARLQALQEGEKVEEAVAAEEEVAGEEVVVEEPIVLEVEEVAGVEEERAEEAREEVVIPAEEKPGLVAEVKGRGAALGAKLQGGETVSIVVLGDKLTAASGVANPEKDGFAGLFCDLLRARFGQAKIALHLFSRAEAVTEEIAYRIEVVEEVLAPRPDLVVVQLGGTDAVQGVPVEDYKDALATLLQEIIEGSKAAVILATPLVEGPLDNLFVQAAKRVGEAAGVVVADFDTAIKSQGRDHRGLFPYGQDPHEYAHTAAARELYRAFQQLVGEEPALGVDLSLPRQLVQLGTQTVLNLRLRNRSPQVQKGKVTLWLEGQRQEGEFTVAAGQTKAVNLSLNLPRELPDGRSRLLRLLGFAQSENQVAADVRWLTLSPVIPCPQLEEIPTLDDEAAWARALPRYPLAQAQIAVGREVWGGENDGSGYFSLARDEDNFYLFVEVRDDRIVPRGSQIWAFNDCLEVFFDLRSARGRGQPFCTRQVLLLFLILPAQEGEQVQVQPLDVQPAGLNQIRAHYTPTDEGYAVQLAMPLAVLQQVAGGPLDSFGFDLAIDDADVPGQRETQLIWAGRANNFVNPRCFGEVSLKPDLEEGTVRLTVW
ncbi:MAG TPA: hypothetical protein EYP85_10185 [Armatimonadetes bacterium]|nr:hypothetical protein [Armatimonadota bacterium]